MGICLSASAIIWRITFSSLTLNGPNAHPKCSYCFRQASSQKILCGRVTSKSLSQLRQRRFFSLGGLSTDSSCFASARLARRVSGGSGIPDKVPQLR